MDRGEGAEGGEEKEGEEEEEGEEEPGAFLMFVNVKSSKRIFLHVSSH